MSFRFTPNEILLLLLVNENEGEHRLCENYGNRIIYEFFHFLKFHVNRAHNSFLVSRKLKL